MGHCEKNSFFKSTFDDETLLKLEIFSGYMREWISVFFTHRKQNYGGKNIQPPKVHIYDFFAGPGADEHGNPGTPLLLIDEIKKYCRERGDIRENGIEPSILFNDSNSKHIEILKNKIDNIRCEGKCCNIRYTINKFHESLKNELYEMQKDDTACLAIMDQFGFSEITSEILTLLSSCPKTDFMFFISSSFIKRFPNQQGIKDRFNLKETDYYSVHRAVCEYYKLLLPCNSGLYLAPFSIRKKNGNIYGIIFGTHHLYGLEKFLRVCWNVDKVTGEANYDIDNDGDIRDGQMELWGDNKIKKVDKFENELMNFIKQKKKIASQPRNLYFPITNIDIYRFTLEHGFLPKHASDIILSKCKAKELLMTDWQRKNIEQPRYLYLNHETKPDGKHLLYILPTTNENRAK